MKKRQIFIELTPLLDVILIMLFVLLVQSRAQVTASAEAVTEAEAAVVQAERATAALQNKLDETRGLLEEAQRRERTLGVVEERSIVVTVSIVGGAVRRVLAEDAAGNAVYVSLGGARIGDASERLHAVLRDLILASGDESAFIVFQYDRNAVYHAEYDLVSGVLRELKPELEREGVYLNIAELDIYKE